MRSFATVALCLALVHTSDARVPHSFRDISQRDAQPEAQPDGGVINWLRRLLRRDVVKRQAATCYEDDYYTFVGSSSLGQGFCQEYMGYPNRTVPVEATATSTLTTTYTTDIDTFTEYTRVTPAVTLTRTVTAGAAKVKRDDDAKITARAVIDRNEVFQIFRRQTNVTANDNAMAVSFSSACSCHDYEGPIVTETYTDQTIVYTLRAFANIDTTVTQIQTAAPVVATTTTTTVGGGSSPTTTASSAAGTTAASPAEGGSQIEGTPTTVGNPSNPTPTAPSFVCPDDNNTTNSQMVGNEKYDYLILCDTVLMDAGIYNAALAYSSFEECVGACSIANQQFDDPVCQGVSFYATSGSGAGNCFLKGSANNTVAADGVDSALLQSVELGVTNDSAAGTTTEVPPFAGAQQTANPSEFNSMMSSILANSTSTMPMVTPVNDLPMSGRQAAAITAYSTYVSDGSTYSSGTGYTFSTSFANGSWYYAYYTSYTLTWASATTVYGASETGAVFENSTTSSSSKQNGENGEYGIVTNTTTGYNNGTTKTEVATVSYEANGTPFFSTTVTYFTFSTAAAGGGSGGGAGGGASGSPASTPAGPLVTSTVINTNGSSAGGGAGGGAGGLGSGGLGSATTSATSFSTQTVISGLPEGTEGASSGFGFGGPPVTFTGVSTIVTNGSTSFQTFYIVSGGPPTGTGSLASGASSGLPSLTPITVISTAGNTGGGSGGFGAGGPGATGGASSLVLSGGPSSSIPASLSIVTVITTAGGTNGASSGFGAGGPGGTGGASSFVLSGGPSSSPTASFTGDNRSGTFSTGPTTNETAPPGTSSPTASFTGDNRSGTFSTGPTTNETAPPGTSSPTASFTGDNRSGTFDTSSTPAPLLTAPSEGIYSLPALIPTAPSGYLPFVTGPLSSGPSPFPVPSGSSAPNSSAPGSSAPPGTSPNTFSNTGVPRSGQYSTSPGTAPGTSPAPPGTSPNTFSNTGVPRSGQYSTSPGTTPGTGPAPSGSQPAGNSTSPASLSNTDFSRIPVSVPLTGDSTSPTAPASMTFPTAQSSCANMTMGTTTLFSTTTVYGCYSTCLPSLVGYDGAPQAFGLPTVTTTATET